MTHPLCILAAGKGTRLGEFTNYLNKALLPLNGKAVISHIIDKVPDSEVIVAVGHKSDTLKQYCLAAHPTRKFTFVQVDPFEGPGSGPGRSVECCRELLQRPFYLTTVDCLVDDEWPALDEDWMGVAEVDEPGAYSTVDTFAGKITHLRNKDPQGYHAAFVGLAGIHSYKHFWKSLRWKTYDGRESELVTAFENCQSYPTGVRAHRLSWHDTGTLENYQTTRHHFEGESAFDFSKTKEVTYIVGGRVLKVFADAERAQRCIARAATIDGVPTLVVKERNTFGYDYRPGRTLYAELEDEKSTLQPDTIWEWLDEKLWKDAPTRDLSASCMKFYRDKTFERYEAYRKKKGFEVDTQSSVSISTFPGESVSRPCFAMESYLNHIDWDRLARSGICARFHGDLQFDNIIRNDSDGFTLLDWRDSFADLSDVGDARYDFAKLYGGMILPYNVIKRNDFDVKEWHRVFTLRWPVSDRLKHFRKSFECFLAKKGVQFSDIELLTGLIYLNMAPLHAAPFDEFLFELSKHQLAGVIGEEMWFGRQT